MSRSAVRVRSSALYFSLDKPNTRSRESPRRACSSDPSKPRQALSNSSTSDGIGHGSRRANFMEFCLRQTRKYLQRDDLAIFIDQRVGLRLPDNLAGSHKQPAAIQLPLMAPRAEKHLWHGASRRPERIRCTQSFTNTRGRGGASLHTSAHFGLKWASGPFVMTTFGL